MSTEFPANQEGLSRLQVIGEKRKIFFAQYENGVSERVRNFLNQKKIKLEEIVFLKAVRNALSAIEGSLEQNVQAVADWFDSMSPSEVRSYGFSLSRSVQDYDPGQISLESVRRAIEVREEWSKDKMTGLWNFGYFGGQMSLFVDSALNKCYQKERSQEEEKQIMESVVTFYFDLDGLKTWNDAFSHETGDKVIEIMGQVLADERLSQWLSEQGVEIVPVRKSGDEFILGCRHKKYESLTQKKSFRGVDGEDVPDKSLAEYIGECIDSLISEEKNVPSEVTTEKIKKIIKEKNIKLKEAEKNGLEEGGFVFKLSTSYGFASLNDAYEKKMDKLSKEYISKLDYAQDIVYNLLVGGMLSLADSNLEKFKRQKKELNRDSDDWRKTLLQKLYDYSGRDGEYAEMKRMVGELRGGPIVETARVIEKKIGSLRETVSQLIERVKKVGKRIDEIGR